MPYVLPLSSREVDLLSALEMLATHFLCILRLTQAFAVRK